MSPKFSSPLRRNWAVGGVLIVAISSAPAHAALEGSTIEDITAAQHAGGTTLRLSFRAPPSELPYVFALDAPPRLVLDFASSAVDLRRSVSFGAGLTETATVISVPGRVRVVLALRQSVRHQLRLQGQDLWLDLAPAGEGPKLAGDKNSREKENGLIAPVAESLLVELEVNGQAVPGIVRADRLADSRLALPIEIWQMLGLRPVGDPVSLPDKTDGYALESVPNLAYRVDRARLVLALTVPAAAFNSSSYSLGNRAPLPLNPSSPGVYFNYNLTAQRQKRSSSFAGSFEAVVFNGPGSLVAGAVVRHQGNTTSVVRTDTYWRKDWPSEMKALVIGDAVGGDGGWSRPVRYGGVRYGRDFALAPGYISYPLPALAGSAALPSTVDVLVNKQRQSSASVKAGPFDLTNVPVVSGAGEINLVVRDLNGVETVLTQSYYSTPQLLATGLSDFSLEGGALRRNFGSATGDYSSAFAAGSYRYGVAPGLTLGGRTELQKTRQAGGVEATALLGTVAVARAAAAWSRSANGGSADRSGAHWLAAIERVTRHASGALRMERFGAGFAQFGAEESELRTKERLQANLGMTIGFGKTAGISYIRQTNWSGDRFTLAAANLGIALPGSAHLSVFASKQLAPDLSWHGGMHLIVPMGSQNTFFASSDRDPTGKRVNVVQASQLAPQGPGWGWNIRASDLASQHAQAGVTLNTNYAKLTADASAGAGANALRLGGDGSVGWFEGLSFATRRIDRGAFAVVRVGDLEGVEVSRSNQVMAVTNSQGLAFVPGLLPYQENVLTLNPDLLPLDIDLGGVKRVAVPYARSGVLLDFPVRRARNVLAILQQANGAPVPPGARVTLSPGNQEFIVAKRGKVYLMDVGAADHIEVRWNGGSCRLALGLDPGKRGETQVGPLVCGER